MRRDAEAMKVGISWLQSARARQVEALTERAVRAEAQVTELQAAKPKS